MKPTAARSSPAALAAVALLTLLAACVPGLPLQAQSDTLPASLLRRLAETADAGRSGRALWIVADRDFPHDVVGVFPGQREALTAARLSGRPAPGVYGPYLTEPDFGLPGEYFWGGCVHHKWSTMMMCPTETAVPLEAVRSVTLLMELTDGRTIRTSVDPRTSDAMIFTVAAWDKFMAPYYTRLYGLEHARELRMDWERTARLTLR